MTLVQKTISLINLFDSLYDKVAHQFDDLITLRKDVEKSEEGSQLYTENNVITEQSILENEKQYCLACLKLRELKETNQLETELRMKCDQVRVC